MTKRHRYQLWQDGIEVAGVDAPNLDSARREIMHYAMVYGQDGPVEIKGDDMAALMAPFKDSPPMSGRPKRTISEVVATLGETGYGKEG